MCKNIQTIFKDDKKMILIIPGRSVRRGVGEYWVNISYSKLREGAIKNG